MYSSSTPIVHIENGPVKGIKVKSVLNDEFYSFRGIPYMKAPLGKLRFCEAKTPRNWSDPFDATNEGPSFCMTDFMTGVQDGQENAGTINVYTKELTPQTPQTLKPVMVWVSPIKLKLNRCDLITAVRSTEVATHVVPVGLTFTALTIYSKKTSCSSRSTTVSVLSDS